MNVLVYGARALPACERANSEFEEWDENKMILKIKIYVEILSHNVMFALFEIENEIGCFAFY